MAHSEACQLFIEQQIEESLEQGKNPYSIGKELSEWVEKLFSAKIPPRTLEQRARRIENATNVAPPTTIEEHQGNPENQVHEHGGKREGSGRPPKYFHEDDILKAAKEIRKTRSAIQSESFQEIPKPLPAVGKYQTIVIDPPWPMQKIDRHIRPNQLQPLDYPTMTLEDIYGLDIPMDSDCHIYLWTTQRFLPDAFKILSFWGAKYVFTMVWHKPGGPQPFGLPQYNSEFAVFGRKGTLDFLETKAFPTCFQAPRREHSRKPDEFYDLVRRVSPGPRLDYFSRETREGFKQFGNETEKFSA